MSDFDTVSLGGLNAAMMRDVFEALRDQLRLTVPIVARIFGFFLALRALRSIVPLPLVGVCALILACWIRYQIQKTFPSHVWARSDSGLSPIIVVREIFAGIVLAFPFAICFEVIPFVGRLSDILRGSQSAENLLPNQVHRSTVCENLFLFSGLGFVFVTGGYELPIRALLHSFQQQGSPGSDPLLISHVVENGANLLRDGTCLVAPIFVSSLLLEGFVGVASRFFGKAAIVAELANVKLVVALFVISSILEFRGAPLSSLKKVLSSSTIFLEQK